ncbi:MAG: non-heme iron oxygenase ferredoxin subunit [Flavobacteriaceae bacterium]
MSNDWVRIADEQDVIEGEPFASEYLGEEIALYRYEGALYAIGDLCTHEQVRLSDGWLEGDRIECPLHQSCFEIRTGKAIEGGPAYVDVPAYAVKTEMGGIYVRRAE